MDKLQRLLARQRALEVEIKKLESDERERQEKLIIGLVRKHGLMKFPAPQIDLALAEVAVKLRTPIQTEKPEAQWAE